MALGYRLILLAAMLAACSAAICNEYAEPAPPQTECGSDDPRIGQTTTWYADLHGIRGTLTIMDNCTIVIENFYYDGIALDARIVGMKGNEDCTHGTILSPDIRRKGGYTNETMTVELPEGVTLDDVERIGLCCAPVGFTFTEGAFK
ncbi:MAG TPA: DM13 domain-containing protein [Phycisphaerae bacterium]|nr:DM13 domain-containing protein [Phycisphaerae bacterium]